MLSQATRHSFASASLSTSAVSARVKAGNGNKIAENVVQLADLRRFESDRQGLVEYVLVIAVTWPEHHAMVAKAARRAIAINRDMSNCQDRHFI